MSKRLRPFFSYFGAKWLLAPKYPAPRHDTLIEWYAGSAQYALLHHTRDVVLIEAYAPVVELWRYLIGATEAEILALPDLPEGVKVRDLGLAPGPSALIGYWLNAATTVPKCTMSKWARSSLKANFWGPRVRERIAAQLPAIRHWQIFEGRVEDFEPHKIEACHFVDPPYEVAGRFYAVSNVDYPALAGMCRGALGQVIACEAEGADWLPFEPLAEVHATANRTATVRTSKEMVWLNTCA